jgi:hypothetical protein
MKRFIAVVLSLGFALSANAQVLTSDNQANSNSQSASGSQSNNANSVSIISSVPDTQNISSEAFSRELVEVSGTQTVKTNTAVGLAAAVSFSSDYCGGTAGVGASALGVTLGGNTPVFDENCQALRRSEKLGMAAVSAYNLGMKNLAAKMEYLAIWQICVSNPTLQDACFHQGVIGENGMANSNQATPILP